MRGFMDMTTIVPGPNPDLTIYVDRKGHHAMSHLEIADFHCNDCKHMLSHFKL
jgi:hypothetical protein